MFLQTPEANEPPTVPVDPMTKREVALILSVNKPYDRKVVAGIDRFTRTHRSWTLYVEDEPLAKIPNLRRWRGQGIIADLDDPQALEVVIGLKIPVVNIWGAGADQLGVLVRIIDHVVQFFSFSTVFHVVPIYSTQSATDTVVN